MKLISLPFNAGVEIRPWPTERLRDVPRNYVGSNGKPSMDIVPGNTRVFKPCPADCRPEKHQDWVLC